MRIEYLKKRNKSKRSISELKPPLVIYSLLNMGAGRKREREREGGGERENMLDFINLNLAHKDLVFTFFINCKINPKNSHKNFVAEGLKMLSRRKI